MPDDANVSFSSLIMVYQTNLFRTGGSGQGKICQSWLTNDCHGAYPGALLPLDLWIHGLSLCPSGSALVAQLKSAASVVLVVEAVAQSHRNRHLPISSSDPIGRACRCLPERTLRATQFHITLVSSAVRSSIGREFIPVVPLVCETSAEKSGISI
jgi:hypothetical protein